MKPNKYAIQLENWISILNKYSEEFSHIKHKDLSRKFNDVSALLSILIGMQKETNPADKEIQEIKNSILTNFSSLYNDLKRHSEVSGLPDDITKNALIQFQNPELLFK